VYLGNLFQREGACHPRVQLAGVDEGGELSQPRPVGVNPDVELTPLGRTLLPVVRAIKDWSETHIAAVHAARAAYDQAAGHVAGPSSSTHAPALIRRYGKAA
jgi:hypothetical protein